MKQVCFTVCLFIRPDLEGHVSRYGTGHPKMKQETATVWTDNKLPVPPAIAFDSFRSYLSARGRDTAVHFRTSVFTPLVR